MQIRLGSDAAIGIDWCLSEGTQGGFSRDKGRVGGDDDIKLQGGIEDCGVAHRPGCA